MNVVVEIEGREAVPVRAIPLLTNWNFLYPDALAAALAGVGGETQSLFGELHAYRRESGKVIAVPESWWASFAVRELTALSERIKATEPSHEVGYQQWRNESLAQLRGGAFVWKDELEAFHRSNWNRRAHVLNASFPQDDEGEPAPPFDRETYELLMASKRKLDSWRELDFSPWIVGSMCALVMDGFEPEQAAKLGNGQGSEKEFAEVGSLFNGIVAVSSEIEYWETRDDTRAGDAKVKRDALLPLYAERDLLEQKKREMRGDYVESYPAPLATTPSTAPVAAESASNAPRVPFKKSALIAEHLHEWPTIERDIADANTNGLASAAKAGARGWVEADALNWARAKGKLMSASKPVDALAQAMHSLGNLPSRKHTLQG